ncbi:MAG TPA: DUF3565 domain-containing protein [Pseudomonas sp.]|uniref:DUF3565 domain-containing protein n=2 Tax=Pseudomonas TaxID=286 RepID=A0A0J6L839_9PSED|nr:MULTISPECIES: DUF3565 domain-containing protein [Pseudomonas]KMN10661.1 pressure-regulated protein [Pseudomonas helleri]KMN21304.1 pressure-regulated protein [Pseudomonas helleri]MQT31202.1 DUF3565 domain-containing protein [Pseudomonas helleri]MQT36079.1 DUF3565 domain-containing protein [Pseudomonas helleri]MQT49563.1 DUF3565 domain-containing protein [Pseudomonas helleri]
METALLAAIVMGRDLLQNNNEFASLTKHSHESEHNQDQRITLKTSTIIGWRQDEEQHWVAVLSCGHTQHQRHQPPWQSRPWVLDPEQRAKKIGQPFRCGWCAQEADSVNLGN